MSKPTQEPPWQRPFVNLMTFKGTIASVSLSHPASCDCQVCKAAQGDEAAFGRLYARFSEQGGTK